MQDINSLDSDIKGYIEHLVAEAGCENADDVETVIIRIMIQAGLANESIDSKDKAIENLEAVASTLKEDDYGNVTSVYSYAEETSESKPN